MVLQVLFATRISRISVLTCMRICETTVCPSYFITLLLLLDEVLHSLVPRFLPIIQCYTQKNATLKNWGTRLAYHHNLVCECICTGDIVH